MKKIPWTTNIVNRFLITKESMALMIDQSTKMLNETVETAKTISTRADKLLAILLPLFSALVVYLSSINYHIKLTFLPLAANCAISLIFISLIFCAFNLRKYTIAVQGEYPKDILQSQFVDNFIEEQYLDRQYISLGISICENIQERILQNENINKKRMSNNTFALYFLFATPFASLLFALLVYYRL